MRKENLMDQNKMRTNGWVPLHGKDLEAASQLLKFEMDEESYSKKFGRKTIFMRYTGSCRFYIPFDRDDPERTRSCYGFKVSLKTGISSGEEEYVDHAAREILQKFDDLNL
jgi:hypothetical protein